MNDRRMSPWKHEKVRLCTGVISCRRCEERSAVALSICEKCSRHSCHARKCFLAAGLTDDPKQNKTVKVLIGYLRDFLRVTWRGFSDGDRWRTWTTAGIFPESAAIDFYSSSFGLNPFQPGMDVCSIAYLKREKHTYRLPVSFATGNPAYAPSCGSQRDAHEVKFNPA